MDKLHGMVIEDRNIQDDIVYLKEKGLDKKLQKILDAVKMNPYSPPGVSTKHFKKYSGRKKNQKALYHIDMSVSYLVSIYKKGWRRCQSAPFSNVKLGSTSLKCLTRHLSRENDLIISCML